MLLIMTFTDSPIWQSKVKPVIRVKVPNSHLIIVMSCFFAVIAAFYFSKFCIKLVCLCFMVFLLSPHIAHYVEKSAMSMSTSERPRPSTPTTYTPIESRMELHEALTDIGDWYTLCFNLGVSEATLTTLHDSIKDYTMSLQKRKRQCLDAFFDHGGYDVSWEQVIRAVSEYPISNKRLAQNIRHKYCGKN